MERRVPKAGSRVVPTVRGPTRRVMEPPAPPGKEVRCPRCGTWDTRPSQQRHVLMDMLMTIFQREPRRCRVCGRRFYSCGMPKHANAD
ncbi:MAG: hypothetical protein LAQ30_03870 [Acidobacteriia bacterium]|nr:hypothetical protein [Terriglobia bacterium]